MKKTSSIAILTIALSLNNLVMAGPGDKAALAGLRAVAARAGVNAAGEATLKEAQKRGLMMVQRRAALAAAEQAGMMQQARVAARTMVTLPWFNKDGVAADPTVGMVAQVVGLHGDALAQFARVKGAPKLKLRRTEVSPIYNVLLQLEAAKNDADRAVALEALDSVIELGASVREGTMGLEQPPLLKATAIGNPDAVEKILRRLGQEEDINALRFEVTSGNFLSALQVAARPGNYNSKIAEMLLECGAITGVEELLLTAVQKDDKNIMASSIDILREKPTPKSPSVMAGKLAETIEKMNASLADLDKAIELGRESIGAITDEAQIENLKAMVALQEKMRAEQAGRLEQSNKRLAALLEEVKNVELKDQEARSAKFTSALEHAYSLIQSTEARKIIERALSFDLDQKEIKVRALKMMKAGNHAGARVMLASLNLERAAAEEEAAKGKEATEVKVAPEEEREGWGVWAWSKMPGRPSFLRRGEAVAAPVLEVVDEYGFTATERREILAKAKAAAIETANKVKAEVVIEAGEPKADEAK